MSKFIKKAGLLLRRGVTLLFDSDYDKYVDSDLSISDRTYEYSYVIGKLADKQKGKILDLGIVSGFCIPALSFCELGFSVHGADLREFSFRHKNYSHHIVDPLKGELPFEDGSFDHAYSISAIEHFGLSYGEYDKKLHDDGGDLRAVKEMARVVKKGGSVLLTMPFAGSEMRVTPGTRHYSMARLEEMVSSAGLDMKECRILTPSSNKDGNLFVDISSEEARKIVPPEKMPSVGMIALIEAVKK